MKKLDKEHLLNKSDTFCMLPWMHLNIATSGDIRPCCVSNSSHPVGDSRTDTLEEAFNSPQMRQLRLDMINDVKNDSCRSCYFKESGGVDSTRKWQTERWQKYFYRVEEMEEDGTVKETTLPYVDFRFSNKCNLRCVSCTPHSSSSWRGDAIKLWNVSGEEIDRLTRTRNIEREVSEIYELLGDTLDDVEEIYFAGGEPMIMPEHWAMLNHLIAIGKTNIKIRYSTNFTKFEYQGQEIFDLWNKFDDVEVGISMDGTHARGEYIRKGIKWENVEKRIVELKERCPRARFKIDCATSIYNIMHVADFHDYMVDNGFIDWHQFHMVTVYGPLHVSSQALHPQLKDKAARRIDLHVSKLELIRDSDDPKIAHRYDLLIRKFKNMKSFMYANDTYEERKDEFVEYVTKLDEIRGTPILDVLPELKKMFK